MKILRGTLLLIVFALISLPAQAQKVLLKCSGIMSCKNYQDENYLGDCPNSNGPAIDYYLIEHDDKQIAFSGGTGRRVPMTATEDELKVTHKYDEGDFDGRDYIRINRRTGKIYSTSRFGPKSMRMHTRIEVSGDCSIQEDRKLF